MNCDCIKRIQDDMGNGSFGEKFPEARCKDLSFDMSNGMISRLAIPFLYQEYKKDGSPKAKKSEIPVYVSFCPFCGKDAKPIKKEKE